MLELGGQSLRDLAKGDIKQRVEVCQAQIQRDVEFFSLSSFGDRLKEAYETSEIPALARKLGVTYQAAKNYVEGRIPSVEKLIDISRSTGCSIDWLLTGEGEKYRSKLRKFDLELSVERHPDSWLDVINEWYEFEGRPNPMPGTMGASFMGGWESFERDRKIAAIRDLKMIFDRMTIDESDEDSE